MVSEHFGSLKGSYIEKRSDDATKTNFVMLLYMGLVGLFSKKR